LLLSAATAHQIYFVVDANVLSAGAQWRWFAPSALRQDFANVVVDFIWQHSLVAFPAISTPYFAVSLAFGTGH
jgi:hypothetical protein